MTITKATMLAVALIICGCASISLAQLAVEPEMSRCADATISLDGPVERYSNAVIQNWLLPAPGNNPAIIEMFADRDRQPLRNLLPWSGEFAGKFITGMVEVERLTGNAELRAATANLVRDLIAKQDADGYLGPYPTGSHLTGKAPNVSGNDTWDAWGHYHAMIGLLLWYDDTHDVQALRSAKRIGDLLCETFPQSGRPISSMGSIEMNQAVVHALALLYERTQDQKYLELAERIVKDFESPSAGDYLRMGLKDVSFFQTPMPRWESLHPIMALPELYWITGNNDYRKAFENLWWSIARLDRHNNGGFSSGEQAQGNPYHQGAIETCCTIAWMAMSVDMLRLTGDPIVADELELSTLNQVLALHDPSGKWSTYNTPMDGRRVPSTVDIAFQIRPGSEQLNCCSVNAARGLGLISDWALMRDKSGLVLNWYGPSTMRATVNSTEVMLKQSTDYPVGGRVDLRVDPKNPVAFALKLRIPHWSTRTTVLLNGGTNVPAEPGSYLTIDRTWTAGDHVQLDFDMSPRIWVGERECAGKSSIYRGPLLLAYEESFPAKVSVVGNWTDSPTLRAAAQKGDSVKVAFEGDSIEWRGNLFDDAGKARVSIDDREVDVVDQYGSKRGEPFVWKRDGLRPGRHTLRIEVSGEKTASSKGTWVNFAEFRAPVNLPEFDAARPSPSFVHGGSDAIITIEVQDVAGKKVQLRDFASAGQHGANYWSWLPVKGVTATEFSKKNPSRTSHVKD